LQSSLAKCQQAISEQAYDDAKAGSDQARASIAQANAAVKTAQINLDYSEIKAPITGYIGPSLITEGALATAQQAQAMAIIRQLDPIYVDLSQSSSEAGFLQNNLMKKRMDDESPKQYSVNLELGADGSNYPEQGALDATDLAVNEETGTIRLRTLFPNPNRVLLPGMFVRASVAEIGTSEAIIVPQMAVKIQPNGAKAVWIANAQNMAEKRFVQTSVTYKNNWILTGGLNTGDRVLLDGTMMMQPGAPLDITMVSGMDDSSNESENQK
jgi:RND family efflux transporter MFP subunit